MKNTFIQRVCGELNQKYLNKGKFGVKYDENDLEKIAYSNLWGMYIENTDSDNLLEEMRNYNDNKLVIKLFCDYRYGKNILDMDNSKNNGIDKKTKSQFIDKIYGILWDRRKRLQMI